MAILTVTEKQTRGGGFNDSIVRTYRRTFEVTTNNVADGPRTVRLAPGLPKLYDSYATGNDLDVTSFCHDIQVESGDTPLNWLVHCEYSSELKKPAEQNVENPFLRPAEIQWGKAEYQRILTRDLTGKPMVASSGEGFDPAPETEDCRLTLLYSRNEVAFNPTLATAYQEAVNSDNFFGYAPGTAKIKSITATRQYENGLLFYRVTYEIHFRRDTFIQQILDQGYRDSSGRVLRDRKTGAALSTPSLLDGNGSPLYIHQDYPVVSNYTKSATDIVSWFPLDPSSGLSITKKDGYQLGFPDYDASKDASKSYQLMINAEIMDVRKYTLRTTSTRPNGAAGVGYAQTWTVVRGTGNTAAAAITGGSANSPVSVPAKVLPVYLNFSVCKALPFAVWRLN